LTRSIHDYFLTKTLDVVRPGGLIALITSRYTMDKEDSTVRLHLSDGAILLGAVRLPNFPAHQCRELTKRIPMNPGVRAIETPDDIVNGNALHRNRKNLSAPMAEQEAVSSRV
jgi:hypothetical protein